MRGKTAIILMAVIMIASFLMIQSAYAGKVFVDNNHEKNPYVVRVTMIAYDQPKDFFVCANAQHEHTMNDPIGAVSKMIVLKPAKCTEGSTDPVPGAFVKEYIVSGNLDAKRTFTVKIDPAGNIQITEP